MVSRVLLLAMAVTLCAGMGTDGRAQVSLSPQAPVAAVSPGPSPFVEYDAGPVPKVGLERAQFRWWSPEGIKLRGVLVLVPGRGGDSRPTAASRDWQALATELQLGMVTCRLAHPASNPYQYQTDPNGATTALMEDSVNTLLARAKVPLRNPPLAFWGHSAGASVSQNFASRRPNRVLAVVLVRSPWGEGEEAPGKTSVPMLMLVGKNDKPEWVLGALVHYQTGHASHAPWTLALSPIEGHELGRTGPLTRAFLSAVVPLRFPPGGSSPGKPAQLRAIAAESSGWLGDPDSLEVAALELFKGDKREATWLPDEATAKAWQAYLEGPTESKLPRRPRRR